MEELQKLIGDLQQHIADLRAQLIQVDAATKPVDGPRNSAKPYKQEANFKGGGSGARLKWIKQVEALVNRTYPSHGRILLNNCRSSPKIITSEHFKVSVDFTQSH